MVRQARSLGLQKPHSGASARGRSVASMVRSDGPLAVHGPGPLPAERAVRHQLRLEGGAGARPRARRGQAPRGPAAGPRRPAAWRCATAGPGRQRGRRWRRAARRPRPMLGTPGAPVAGSRADSTAAQASPASSAQVRSGGSSGRRPVATDEVGQLEQRVELLVGPERRVVGPAVGRCARSPAAVRPLAAQEEPAQVVGHDGSVVVVPAACPGRQQQARLPVGVGSSPSGAGCGGRRAGSARPAATWSAVQVRT